MSQYASVSNVAQLRELRASLSKFSATAAAALDEVTSDIQRTLVWLTDDRSRYWNAQVRLATEQFVRAKSILNRKQIFDRALAGATTSCIDEKKELKKAEARLTEAKRKLAKTRSWIQRIEKDLSDYKASVAGLTSAVDSEIPNARAALDKMIDSLESYVALAPPETPADMVAEDQEKPLRPVTEMPTELDELIDALRAATPSEQTRRDTPLASNPIPWLSNITLSDTLTRVAKGNPTRQQSPAGLEKVLVARLEKTPGAFYLERVVETENDCGWYFGPADGPASDSYAAISVTNLIEACPSCEEVLGLPAGTLILADSQKSTEVIVDSDNNVLWQGAEENDTPQPTEPTE